MKKHNFSPGPAILPASVLKEAAKGVTNYQGTGLSLLELSHRGPEFTAIIEEATALNMVIPADGPSLGIAPSGTWM